MRRDSLLTSPCVESQFRLQINSFNSPHFHSEFYTWIDEKYNNINGKCFTFVPRCIDVLTLLSHSFFHLTLRSIG